MILPLVIRRSQVWAWEKRGNKRRRKRFFMVQVTERPLNLPVRYAGPPKGDFEDAG